jgi:hypothetical protein
MADLVEVLIYAAALDLYTRTNLERNGWRHLPRGQSNAMLKLVNWYARPAILGR